ncbi:hypothetical protein [Phenylobacterium sp.]|uniref:hypothetical protein n=1 Tax=Phenylobacterium sp. TaxID=1871053 RepID=UPI002DF16F5B|nr:hypothetical protein [Phenylobacterium sp.]
MMSRIDPIRRAVLLRRAARPEPDAAEEAASAEVVRLPVPVERVNRILPRDDNNDGQAAFAAQLMGQDGAKRGLRAGPELIDSAKSLYNRTEWSGSKDRRAPTGGRARTKI